MKQLNNHSKKHNIFEMKNKADLKKEEFVGILAEIIYVHMQKINDKEAEL